jgi:hypothetical protein
LKSAGYAILQSPPNPVSPSIVHGFSPLNMACFGDSTTANGVPVALDRGH